MDLRLDEPRDRWLARFKGLVRVDDDRGRKGSGQTCWANGTLASCGGGGDPNLIPAQLERESWDHVDAFLVCAIEQLEERPADRADIAIHLVVASDGHVTATIEPQSIFEPAPLQRCVDALTGALTSKEDAGELTVTLSFWDEGWCDQAPLVSDESPSSSRPTIRVLDVKAVPHWALLPNGGGYWLLRCDSREYWRLTFTDGGLAIIDGIGRDAGRVSPSSDGFEVLDGMQSRVLRASRRGNVDHLEDAKGAPLGELALGPKEHLTDPDFEVFTNPKGEPSHPLKVNGRWHVGWYQVEPETLPSYAAAVLELDSLKLPYSAALIAYLSERGAGG